MGRDYARSINRPTRQQAGAFHGIRGSWRWSMAVRIRNMNCPGSGDPTVFNGFQTTRVDQTSSPSEKPDHLSEQLHFLPDS